MSWYRRNRAQLPSPLAITVVVLSVIAWMAIVLHTAATSCGGMK